MSINQQTGLDHEEILTSLYKAAALSKAQDQGAAELFSGTTPVASAITDLPLGVSDLPTRRNQGADTFIEHPTRLAIYTAAAKGAPLSGATLVTLRSPCASCARAIIASGITTVVCHRPPTQPSQGARAESIGLAWQMLVEADVTFIEEEFPLPLAPAILLDGHPWKP